MQNQYYSDSEVENLVRDFESCKAHPSAFNHRAHLTTAVWYLTRLPFAEAHERLRTNLQRFLQQHKIEGYNETVTLFWLRLVNERIGEAKHDGCAYEIANRVIESLGCSQIIYDYYTKERLASEEARGGWIEPDVKPLECD